MRAAALVAVDDLARDGVGAAQQSRRVVEAALQDRLADARAADRRAVECDGRDRLDGEAMRRARVRRGGGVALAVAAEGPVLADGDLLQIGKDAARFHRRSAAGESSRRAASNFTAMTATVPCARM